MIVRDADQSWLRLLGHTYDVSAWFRKQKVLVEERWKSHVFSEDGYSVDKKVQMGRTNAAFSGRRLSLFITQILEDREDRED